MKDFAKYASSKSAWAPNQTVRYEDAYCIASVFCDLIQDVCQETLIAGSVRRKKETVGDIDIVLLPIFDQARTNLLGEVESANTTYSRLEVRFNEMLRAGYLQIQPGFKMGERYREYSIHDRYHQSMKLEMHIANNDNFGYISALRTGSEEFMHALVKRISKGGLMPEYLQHENGFLWWRKTPTTRELISVPTEEHYFRTLKCLPDNYPHAVILPQDRTADMVDSIRTERRLPLIFDFRKGVEYVDRSVRECAVV